MQDHIRIVDITKCYGCRSCEQKCQLQCIKMIEDNEGFYYPSIDEEKCVNCGLCIKHCPQFNAVLSDDQLKAPDVYAAKVKDINIRMNSSSGGMFSAVAEKVLEKNGVVFGCAFDEHLIAKHMAIENKEDLRLLRGSKYVASNLNDTYRQVKVYLEDGRVVFYTGSPCHIAGLKAFLGKSYTNLITADIICHGTPSQKLFTKYINWLEEKKNMKICAYDFRNKETKGWRCGNIKISFQKEEDIVITRPISVLDPYFSAFVTSETFRPSCYKCKYTSEIREGDYTFADFWGIELFHPEFYSSKGVSLLLVNTEKGQSFFEEFKSNIDYVQSRIEYATKKNGHLNDPEPYPKIRNVIYNEIDKLDFETYAHKYLYPKDKVRQWIKYMLPERIKVMIKQTLFKIRKWY